MDVSQRISRGRQNHTHRCERGFEVQTFGCSTCGPQPKRILGEGKSHENGCGGLARGRPTLTHAPRNGLVRRTGLGMALEFVPDDQMLPAK